MLENGKPLPTSLVVHCLERLGQGQQGCEEIVGLTRAIGLKPSAVVEVKIKKQESRTYLTKGKVEEVALALQAADAELVIFNGQLTPRQQQNLEEAWEVKILDRTALILEIFGHRARSKEAKLQTDLAQLAYQQGRLVRSWTHLERQRGGAGFMGGPGERQVESDKRQIAMRIKSIRQKLESVRARRAQNRAARQKTNLPVVALVGYTNAGKSTLFNLLTKGSAQARNVLFDTLDTKMGQVHLPDGSKIILSDTVGFISNLPHDLVAAFRATLEEVSEAEIIIHLRDFSHADTLMQKKDVEEILKPLQRGQPIIEVLNKTDATCAIAMNAHQKRVCAISALTGDGVDGLFAVLSQTISALQQKKSYAVVLPTDAFAAQNLLYERGKVLSQRIEGQTCFYEVILPSVIAGFLEKNYGAEVCLQDDAPATRNGGGALK